MKKIITILLAFMLCFGMVACTSDDDKDDDSKEDGDGSKGEGEDKSDSGVEIIEVEA